MKDNASSMSVIGQLSNLWPLPDRGRPLPVFASQVLGVLQREHGPNAVSGPSSMKTLVNEEVVSHNLVMPDS